MIEKADGDYDGALKSLDTAAAIYPRDRVVLNQIGPHPVSASGNMPRRLRYWSGSATGGSRGSADALHLHALLPRPGRYASGRARTGAVPALQSRGIGAIHHRQAAGCSARKTTMSGNRFTITKACRWTASPRHAKLCRSRPEAANEAVFASDLSACADAAWQRSPASRDRSSAAPVHFTDVTAQAGIKFVHNSGRAGKKYLPETLGSGVRILRCRWRRLARHPADQQQGLDAARPQVPAGSLSQQPQRHIHRYHGAAAASMSRCTAWA